MRRVDVRIDGPSDGMGLGSLAYQGREMRLVKLGYG
jgi:hypothetical protein